MTEDRRCPFCRDDRQVEEIDGRYFCQTCAHSWALDPFLITCPHCGGAPGSCCACDGTGRTDERRTREALRYVWRRPGCACSACGRLQWQPAEVTESEGV